MLEKKTLGVIAIVALGSLSLASAATASDASVKAAGDAQDARFSALANQQRKATIAWTKADRSKRTSAPLLRILKKADRLEDVVTRNVKAESPSTPTGSQAKLLVIRSNANFSRYLKALGRAVRLATAGKITPANRQLKLATGWAKRADQQAQESKRLFAQVLPPAPAR